MGRYVALILCLLLISRQSVGETDAQHDGLSETVHIVVTERASIANHYGSWMEGPKIKIQSSEYNRAGQLVERVQFSAQDGTTTRLVYHYGANGDPTEWLVHDKHEELMKRKLYEYNADGVLMREVWYDAAGAITEQRVYRYDVSQALIEVAELRANRPDSVSLLTRYNPKGNVSEETRYQPGGSLATRTAYLYDTQERISDMLRYAPSGALLNRTAYVYDPKGRVAEVSSYREDGALDSRWISAYDAKGNVLSSERRDATGNVDEQGIYRYENRYKYDAAANWLERHTTELVNQGGRPVQRPTEVVYRKITYHTR